MEAESGVITTRTGKELRFHLACLWYKFKKRNLQSLENHTPHLQIPNFLIRLGKTKFAGEMILIFSATLLVPRPRVQISCNGESTAGQSFFLQVSRASLLLLMWLQESFQQ